MTTEPPTTPLPGLYINYTATAIQYSTRPCIAKCIYNYDIIYFQILKVACLMEYYIIMVIWSPQTASQIALATEAHGNVNLRSVTVISARLMPMDTSIRLMAPHMTTEEPVNTCWLHHVATMITP